MKIGVIFSGSGVFDGTEIHEGVFTLLSIKKQVVKPFAMLRMSINIMSSTTSLVRK
jgi:enhancing lycopene biosynthesis protein 2